MGFDQQRLIWYVFCQNICCEAGVLNVGSVSSVQTVRYKPIVVFHCIIL